MVLYVSDSNRHNPNGIPGVLTFILLRDVDFAMGPTDFCSILLHHGGWPNASSSMVRSTS